MNNKEIYDLIMELGSNLADLGFQWSDDLRSKFEKSTAYLSNTSSNSIPDTYVKGDIEEQEINTKTGQVRLACP